MELKPIPLNDPSVILLQLRMIIAKEFGAVEWHSVAIEPVYNKDHEQTRVSISFTLADKS